MTDRPSPRIRVDWTVPIWGVIGLAVQAVGLVWFLATLNGKVATNADRIDKLEGRVAGVERSSNSIGVTLGILDERTRNIDDRLKADHR